jgi:hypothetical protein
MPQISKQIVKDLIATLDAYGCGAHHLDLLPLLDQPEGEPVAELLLSRSGHGIVVEWHKTMPVGTKLYTHPAPFTPITADDVTDEMLKKYDELCYDEASTPQQHLAAVLNLGTKK